MRMTLKAALAVAGLALAAQAAAQVTFYEREDFRGGAVTADGTISDFEGMGFNDRASSATVAGGRWEVCEHADFNGRCVILRPGNYASLAQMGMNNRISSIRPVVGEARYPAPPPAERLHEVNVAAVHAVVGPPEQRCWVEREQVTERGGPNIGGAIVGGIIGGVLGHQIGGGRGRDVATAGGAVAGAAIGSNVGRGGTTYSQDVQRCAAVPDSARPEYWDVTYYFRGVEHHVQMSTPPGPTLWVDDNGNPRG